MTSIEEYRARKARWVEALRSGKYKQGKGRLRDGDCFCCLGVGCDVYDPSGWGRDAINGDFYRAPYIVGNLPPEVRQHFGVKRMFGEYGDYGGLAEINDDTMGTFSEIADIIDSEPEGLFTWTTPG